MDIDFALIADYAEVVNGKLYLMGGGWEASYAKEAPANIRMAVVVGVRVGWEETNQPVPVQIRLEDDDGAELVRIDGNVNVGRPAQLPPGSTQLTQMAANIGFVAPRLGVYRVRVNAGSGDGAAERVVPFRVVTPPS